MDRIRFHINDVLVEERDVAPTTTLLDYLRRNLRMTGTKEGCAEGDCGACSVVILDASPAGEGESHRPATFRAVNSCLVFLPMVQGRRVYTVEGLREGESYHLVQRALADAIGSQCGYCTPGIVMSMFEACYRPDMTQPWQIDDQLCGNLCRCTGYRPIREAARAIAGAQPEDRFSGLLREAEPGEMALSYEGESSGSRYYNPTSFEALFELMEDHPEAYLVAGGTDLGLEVSKRFRRLPVVIGLEGIRALRTIARTSDGWRFGAGASLTEIQEATAGTISALEKMIRFFASRQIKNRATIGGNLCTASPIGDLAPVLLALDAQLRLRSARGERVVPIDEFFVSYRKTALAPGEILAAIDVPDIPVGAKVSSYKVSKRRELDISAVAAGFFVQLDDAQRVTSARLAYGGMAATPARARPVEAFLVGQRWCEDTVRRAMDLCDGAFTPIDDHRASAWYRRAVARNLLLGFYLETQGAAQPRLLDRPTSTVHLSTLTGNP